MFQDFWQALYVCLSGKGHAKPLMNTVSTFKSCISSHTILKPACLESRILSDKIGEDFSQKKEVLYIPCHAHRLNTFVERSSKASKLVSAMFDILQTLYTFFASSTKRSEALEKEQDKVVGALKIRNLSQTYFVRERLFTELKFALCYQEVGAVEKQKSSIQCF